MKPEQLIEHPEGGRFREVYRSSRTVVAVSRNRFCHVIPAGIWQAAEPLGGEVLVGCSVAPGFEFTGFQLIDPEGEDARRLLGLAPHLARLVRP
jgi:predicted cupin superfamily sugar epimerase